MDAGMDPSPYDSFDTPRSWADPGTATTELRFQAWQYDLGLGLFSLFFAAMTGLAVGTAETTGGQLAGGLFMGAGLALCLGAWANIRLHPPRLLVGAEAIVRGARGRGEEASLLKATSADLGMILVRAGRGAHWNLVQPGSDSRVDIQGFKKQDVADACRTHGWRLAD
jgi:hypothetical protein